MHDKRHPEVIVQRCRQCGAKQTIHAATHCMACGEALPGQSSGEQEPSTTSSGLLLAPPVNDGASIKDVGSVSSLGPLPADNDSVDIAALLDTSIDASTSVTAPTAAWRARNRRGLIFEAETVEAMRAHVRDAGTPDEFDIARGDEMFRPLREHAEFSDMVDLSGSFEGSISDFLEDMSMAASMNTASLDSSHASSESSHMSLELDLASASQRHAGQLGTRQPNRGQAASPAVAEVELGPSLRYFGLGSIACLFLAALLSLSWFAAETETEKKQANEAATRIKAGDNAVLKRAIDAMDARRYTTATQILERIASRSNNPEVHRRLAIALAQTNRPQDAKRALNRYRALVEQETTR